MAAHFKTALLITAALTSTIAPSLARGEPPAKRPNIVYVLCDDLGYGDVHCLNPDRGKIATPNSTGWRPKA